MNKQIILASGSPRRKKLLQQLGVEFEVRESNFEEDMSLKMSPKKLVQVLAMGKAESVAKEYLLSKKHKNTVIIAADTVVVFKNKILGKPKTPQRATAMLKSLSGQAHLVLTGLVVWDLSISKKYSTTVVTKVVFRKLSKQEITKYVNSKEPLDKAGAYAIQENAGVFVEKIYGDYNNIVGLPVAVLSKYLKALQVMK